MKVGWIGTGVMGRSMAGHVQAAGHELYVYNRTKAKAQDLLEKGAIWCDSPAQVAGKSEILFSIVGLPIDVEETYLGKHGVLS
ncbi:MAG: 2-hydroxy-3-oxopropionate reductase, partial [Deltaproteobacteria bacterium]|nr:2-hydroxy-3-oxopropionate reductase [Deltaproteobacteria bacterium]